MNNQKLKKIFKVLISLAIIIAISLILINYVFLNSQEPVKNTYITKGLDVDIPNKYFTNKGKCPNDDKNCLDRIDITLSSLSDVELKYVQNAYIHVYKNIKDVNIKGATISIRYDSENNVWKYYDSIESSGIILESIKDGDNIVTKTNSATSLVFSDHYIIEKENEKKVVVLTLPVMSRARCDLEVDSVFKNECVDLLKSYDIDIEVSDWIPKEKYEEFYNDLKIILGTLSM